METNNFLNITDTRFLVSIGIFVAALILIIILYRFVVKKLQKKARKSSSMVDDFIIDVLRMPFLLLLIWVLFRIFSSTVFFDTRFYSAMDHVLNVLLIVTIGWILIKLTRVMFYYLEHKLDVQDYKARGSLTKLKIFERMLTILIVIITVSIALMTFDTIRTVGVSILTSAGIAGIIVGFAAQKSLGAVLAGIQLALTQPIRMDDQVIVEGESGRIEEIKLTYVVVKLWDERRLILPASYFLEKPFQNWTSSNNNIMGTVFLYVDYSLPLDALRKEFQKIIQNNPNWDKRVGNIQVTDMKDNSIELRVLVSSSNSSANWDLRVEIREKLIKFIQDNYPEGLVKARTFNEIAGPKDDNQNVEA